MYAFAIRVLSGVVFADGIDTEDTIRGFITIGALTLVVMSVILYVNVD